MHYTVDNNRINLSNYDTWNGHIYYIRDLLFHGNFMKTYPSQHLHIGMHVD